MPSPTYSLKLHKTYYVKGFFNLGVSVEKYVRRTSGPIEITLGRSGRSLNGHVSREANSNGTPRVYGGIELRDWLQNGYSLYDQVVVEIPSPNVIHLS